LRLQRYYIFLSAQNIFFTSRHISTQHTDCQCSFLCIFFVRCLSPFRKMAPKHPSNVSFPPLDYRRKCRYSYFPLKYCLLRHFLC